MDRIRYCANLSVMRACGFGVLAIFTVVVGLSADPALAVRMAALLFTLMTSILLLLAWRAPFKPYRKREVWIMLDGHHGLPEHRAHEAISAVMRETFLTYAGHASWAALACWVLRFVAPILTPG